MTAEELGERLLGEVESETLDKVGDDDLGPHNATISPANTTLQFLQKLCHRNDPSPSSQLGIPALDKLLNIFQAPNHQEAPDHQQPWTSPQRNSPLPPAPNPATKPPVIELTSTSPCSGATQLLYHMTAISVLPPTFDSTALQGKGGAVVLLDNAGTFDVQRLQRIMRHHIQQHLPPSSTGPVRMGPSREADADMEALIHTSLQHVHVFHPTSSRSLLATLHSLPSYLLSPTAHLSGARHLQALLIDDIGAFVWLDRAELAAAPPGPNPDPDPGTGTSTSTAPTPLAHRYRTLTTTLQTLQSLLPCPIIATNRALLSPSPSTSSSSSSSRSPIRPHLPFAWTSFVTLRLIVERVPVPKFRESLSVQGAWREAGARREAVERGERVVRVDWWGWEGWRAGVREGLEREGEGVRVCVGAEGVVVGEELVRWRGG